MKSAGGNVSTVALMLAITVTPDAAAAAAARLAITAYEATATAAMSLASLTPPEGGVQGQEIPPSTPPIPVQSALPAQTAEQRRNINPYDRDIAMTVPLNFNRRVLGEMPVVLTRDDRFIVESAGFQALLEPLLTPEARTELASRLAGHETFAPEEINQTGIQLDYDPDQLAVLVLRIDPTKRSVESLFQGNQREDPGLPPEDFSAYMNANISVDRRQSTGDVSTPAVFLNGAVRYKRLVFEADVQARDDFITGEYDVVRRYARIVYDEPENYRRWFLGDIDPEVRGRQGIAQMGGFGVARQRARFDSFRNNILSGGRQIVLQESSTIRVLRNGIFVREFQLDPGQYDLSNIPLDTGSNDIELEIRGPSGLTRNVSYSAYLDGIDLEPGDYEYAAYIGAANRSFIGSPDYSDGDVIFTGFWRKAFENRPAVGIGLQASEEAQTLTGQSQVYLRSGARLRLDGAVSNADVGEGYAYAVSFDHILDLGDTYDSWTVVADYTSEDFATPGNPIGQNNNSWIFSGGYTHQFSKDWLATLSASYRMSRSDVLGDAYSVSATSIYRFNPEWSVQLGAEVLEYGSGQLGSQRDGFGVNFALIWQPRFDRRAEARYSSARNSGSVRYQQLSENSVGSLGYSVASTYDDGPGTISGQVDYIANRFDASVSHAVFGRDFSNITDEQVTSLRVGTSISTAGGKVAVGRNIYDSFAIVHPHETLRDSPVIVGDSLAGGRYTSRSGALGPAVANSLSSYVNQSLRYDALNVPQGYNVGDGITRLRPTYRSGYAIEVGMANFVSAVGRLVGNGDKPVALVSGRVRPADDPNAAPELFFTNSVGRFAVQNLQPGKRYLVELFSSPATAFEFTVPEDNDGLLDLQIVRVPLDVQE